MCCKKVLIIRQEFYWEISFLYWFWDIRILISFATSATVTELNVNHFRFSWTVVIASTLGWFLHFIIAFRVRWSILSESGSAFCDSDEFRLVTILEQKSFKLFATLSYKLIVINKSYFSEEIVLLETNDLTIVKKDLLSITLFIINDEKYSFLAFRRSDTHLFLCFWNKRLFSSPLCFRKRFLILLRIIIALEISALMNVYDQHASIVVSVMRAYWKLHNR